MNRLAAFLKGLAWLAFGIGTGLVAYVTFVVVDARVFDAEYRAAPAASVDAPLVPGAAIGELYIERLGLTVVVGEGETGKVLRRGAGHLTDSAWLGQRGNVVIAGHRDTFFRPLRKIQPGDLIDLKTQNQSARYSVESAVIVSPQDLSVLAPGDGNTLTLITCYPFTFVGSAPERFVVRARQVRNNP
jgi:sortase A